MISAYVDSSRKQHVVHAVIFYGPFLISVWSIILHKPVKPEQTLYVDKAFFTLYKCIKTAF